MEVRYLSTTSSSGLWQLLPAVEKPWILKSICPSKPVCLVPPAPWVQWEPKGWGWLRASWPLTVLLTASEPTTRPRRVRTWDRRSRPTGSRKFTPCHCRVKSWRFQTHFGKLAIQQLLQPSPGESQHFAAPAAVATCPVSNQHSWFRWCLPTAVWVWSSP